MKKEITAKEWNSKYPVGTRVKMKDGILEFDTKTRSQAWTLGSGTAVVALVGHAGGWGLSFLTLIDDPEEDKSEDRKEGSDDGGEN